ncbi:hypothetical protein PC118_g6069 [Phytophthora cactorum]|uniref:Uncharacterized protein n=2 Tax=Phytophthora cactorum TaxID=29920 RepID=A0A8T1GA71_9STRA|nr:hypothetical protein PC118_g6069 [Phytophthora cactorum]
MDYAADGGLPTLGVDSTELMKNMDDPLDLQTLSMTTGKILGLLLGLPMVIPMDETSLTGVGRRKQTLLKYYSHPEWGIPLAEHAEGQSGGDA